ncbi:MAG: radical SAM protein [Planctomycetes bacterium]|nr:radical SAM protein [Planctomycetota bacterium]
MIPKIKSLQQRVETLWTLATVRSPVYMILYLTSRCNFRCPMCFYLDEIKDPNKEELAFAELEKMARSMGRLVQLSLTGGEPFLRHDIPEVVEIFARHNAVQYVTIPTNGSLPDRIHDTVERLVTDFPKTNFRIPISLDGFPKDHDEIRGGNSFDKIEQTLERLNHIRHRVDNLTLDINTCYSALNQGKLHGFVEFVADRFDVDNHCVTYVRGNADESTKDASIREYVEIVEDIRRRRNPRESRPFSSFLRAVMDYQRDIIKWTLQHDKMYVPCMAGRKMIVVNEKAEVLPCEILNKRLGSLKDYDYDVGKLMNNPQALELVDWIRRTKCHCTFECALATSIIFHKASYPRIFWRAFKQWLGAGSEGASRKANRASPSRPVVSLPILK